MLRIDFVTLFPEMVLGAVGHSILKRAAEAGLVQFGATNPRDFATDRHRTVDDAPYGGGPGMVMRVEPICEAVASLGVLPQDPGARGAGSDPEARPQDRRIAVVLTDPTGPPFTQPRARELSAMERLVFVCGHYEGIDGRIQKLLGAQAFSIGDFVLTGGELPALVMADAVVRLLPGALGSEESLHADSHAEGLLTAPQFTRPPEFRGERVPEVLLSGDHGAIAAWRREQALRLTRSIRPDLFARARLDKTDLDMLSS